MNRGQHLLAIDVETGGFLVGEHALLAIGAQGNWDQEPFYVKVRPGGKVIDPAAAAVNGYTPEGWEDAVRLDLAMLAFRDWLKERPKEIEEVWPLAHNAAFDRAWIEWAEVYTGIDLGLTRKPWRCSMAVMAFVNDMKLQHEASCSLDELCKVAGLERLEHNAMIDAACALYGYAWMAKEISTSIKAGVVSQKMGIGKN